MKTIGFVSLLLLLSSCSAIGTKTLYKTANEINARNIGITELDCDEGVNLIHPETREIYRDALDDSFKSYGLSTPLQLPDYVLFEDTAVRSMVWMG